MNKVIGIDISKQTFDAYGMNKKGQPIYLEQTNNQSGFRKLLAKYGKENIFIMEATGPYYLRLATFLYKKGVKVSVVNPLVIKRFSQMNLQRAKTDRKDARIIYEYSVANNLKIWQPDRPEIAQMNQLLTALELINKQATAIKNQVHALNASGYANKDVLKTLKELIIQFSQQKEYLEHQLERIINMHFSVTYNLLQSIPGIGKKAAAILIAITNNFEKFIHYKQLIAYVGMSPRIYQSGISVKGKGHICKMGNANVRKQMYISSWTAKFHNKACAEMYERLAEKGKPERVIKIAIANKLLKQAFAIVKTGKKYDETFISQHNVA
jgi:transposase